MLRLASLVIVVIALLAACGRDAPDQSSAVTGEVIVSAASSLTEAFTDAARAFETKYPGTKVTLNFASSAALATQINEGAPADVFASADRVQMDAVTREQAVHAQVFAGNRLVIARPKGSRAVMTYADLAKPGLILVLAADGVPVGNYAVESLRTADQAGDFGAGFQARVLANVKSREPNVRAVLAKVQLGEADAAIVYRTDIATAPEVEGVPIPDAYNVAAEYLIAPLTGGRNPSGGTAFVAFILSVEGQTFLAERGFTMPPR